MRQKTPEGNNYTPIILDEGLTRVLSTALVGFVVRTAANQEASTQELETMLAIADLLICESTCRTVRNQKDDRTKQIMAGAMQSIDVLFHDAAKVEVGKYENHR